MKKKTIKFITIATALMFTILSVVFVSTGCGLIERAYDRENARVIATIREHTQNAYVNRSVIIIDGELVYLEFNEFNSSGRAISARKTTMFGDPYLRNGQEVIFDVFTGQEINTRNALNVPRWTTPQLQQLNRDHFFAFERDANGHLLRTELGASPALHPGDIVADYPIRRQARIGTSNIAVPFTSPEVRIYQAQLVNHFNQFAGQFINQGMTIEQAVDQLMGILVNQEIVLIEADRQFFVGNLYWTEDDIYEIQRSVYHTIDAQILRHKNQILERRGQPHITVPDGDDDLSSPPSVPVPQPPPEEVPPPSPRIHAGRTMHDNGQPIQRAVRNNDGTYTPVYRWHDDWYLNDAWFLHDGWDANLGAFSANQDLVRSFPGMHGDASRRSLAREALNAFLEEMLDNAERIIGLSPYNHHMDDVQRDNKRTLEEEAAFLRNIRDTKGIEYVYPILGNTLTVKLLIGVSSINQAKMEKLQALITRGVTVSEGELVREWQDRVQRQQARFGGLNNTPVNTSAYSAAVEADELMLFTPSNRYVWVKHILLPFENGRERMVAFDATNDWGTEAAQTARREAYRLNMRRDMNVYRAVDGERDTDNPFRPDFVINQIYATMARYRNTPHLANEAFHRLIFEWNTDPGAFNNTTGYQVIQNLLAEDEDPWMPEFAAAAREFRTRGFSIGQLLTEDNGAPRYAITDFGIHIMFYASDPFHFNNDGVFAPGFRTLSLDCFTTPMRSERVRDIIHADLLGQRQSGFYNNWEADHIVNMRRLMLNDSGVAYRNGESAFLEIEEHIVEELARRWHDEIFGRR